MKAFVLSALTLLLVSCATSADRPGRAPQDPPDEPWASSDRELTLLNAYDAFGPAREDLRQDFGFSVVIRRGDVTILFDAGTRADVFEANLRALGVDLEEIDYAVASHSHHDHIAGFDVLLRKNPGVKLFLPPDFFGLGAPIPFSVAGPEPGAGKALPKEQRYFGGEGDGKIRIDSTGRFWNAENVTYVSEPLEILPGVRLIPTRSELMGTFMRYPPHGDEPLLIPMPELSLGLSTSKGEVLVVGCSHSSVEEIVKRARATSEAPIDLVVGGYHLLPYARDEVAALAERLRTTHGVRAVAPCHCTGHIAFDEFRKAYGDAYRLFGLGSKIEY